MPPTEVAWVKKNRPFQISSTIVGVAADQPRRHVIAQQRDDGRAAGADRVAVTGAGRAIVGEDANDRRFLGDEGLDRVGAFDLRRQVDLLNFEACDFCHDPGFSRVGSNSGLPIDRGVT